MKKAETEMKRLIVEINLDIHCEIKKRAAVKNMTIKQWILEAVRENIKREQHLGFE